MPANLERAIEIAKEAHAGQTRLDGSPYVVHPLRVMRMLEAQGHSPTTQIIGVLHDVTENNSDWPIDRLREEGYDDEVLIPLALLTRKDGQDYDEYIEGVARDPRARPVKEVDIIDNLNDYPADIEPSEWRKEKVRKYTQALLYLTAHENIVHAH